MQEFMAEHCQAAGSSGLTKMLHLQPIIAHFLHLTSCPDFSSDPLTPLLSQSPFNLTILISLKKTKKKTTLIFLLLSKVKAPLL